MRNIKELTGLRFLAAFYVFIFHIDMSIRTPLLYLPDWLKSIVQEGRLGVTLFFVLSGFVLTYSHLKDFQEPKFKDSGYFIKFLFKRLARIYPVYFAGLILSLLVSSFFNNLPTFKVVFLNLTFLQTYFPKVIWLWYGGGAWSVSNEIFFYLLFPFALPLLLLINQKNYLIYLIGILAVFGTSTNIISHFISQGKLSSFLPIPFNWAYWFPLFRFPEFLIGILTGILVFRFKWRVKDWIVILLLSLSTIYLSVLGPKLPGTLTHNWIIIPTIVSLLSSLSQQNPSKLFKWLGTKPLEYLGQISYAFYIFQLPLLITLDELIKSGSISQNNFFVLPAAFILNLIGAILLHEGIEKKAHAYLMKTLNERTNKAKPGHRVYSKV